MKATRNMNKETLETMARELGIATEGLTKRQLVDAINAADKTEEQTADKTEEQTADKTEEQTADKTEEQTADKTEEQTADKTEEQTADKTNKKERKPRKHQKTFEELVADIPLTADLRLERGSKDAVHVKRGTARLFRYSNRCITTNREELVEGLEYEVKGYGIRVKSSRENLAAILANANKLAK